MAFLIYKGSLTPGPSPKERGAKEVGLELYDKLINKL